MPAASLEQLEKWARGPMAPMVGAPCEVIELTDLSHVTGFPVDESEADAYEIAYAGGERVGPIWVHGEQPNLRVEDTDSWNKLTGARRGGVTYVIVWNLDDAVARYEARIGP